MKKNLLILSCILMVFLIIKPSVAKIKKNNFYTCDSIKYPKYNFGYFLNKDNLARVFKISKKKFLYYEIEYNDYITFVNLSLKDFIGININLIEDDIYNLFWKIALPSSIGTIFQNLYSLVDAIFAGRMISEIALAAIGQTFPIYFVIIALGIGLSIATTSIVANSIGEKKN